MNLNIILFDQFVKIIRPKFSSLIPIQFHKYLANEYNSFIWIRWWPFDGYWCEYMKWKSIMAVSIWDVVLDEVISDPTLQSISRNDGIWKASPRCAFDDAWSAHPIWQTSTHILPIDSKTVFLRCVFLNEPSSDCFLCKFLHNPQNYIYEFDDFASFVIFSAYFSNLFCHNWS